MGQYFRLVNLDKKEYLSPHALGSGAKLWEIAASHQIGVLAFLLRKSSEDRAGGDIQKEYKNAGRWAGDKIVLVGDYDNSKLFHEAGDTYTEISKEIIEEYNDFIELEDHFLGEFHYCKKCKAYRHESKVHKIRGLNEEYACEKCPKKENKEVEA